MVGHTGFMDKAMEAAAHTDYCIGKIRDACAKAGVRATSRPSLTPSARFARDAQRI